MTRVISKESIQRANENMKRNSAIRVSSDSRNISARVSTSFGSKEIIISKEKILRAANSAMK